MTVERGAAHPAREMGEHSVSHTVATSTRQLAREHLFPHFTRSEVWSRDDLPVVVRGEGCYVYDDTGRRFLDGLSGLFCVNIGHGRADLASVAAAQMGTLAYWTNWSAAHPAAAEAARLIAELAPADLNTVFFVNSGSEAVESAIKFARQYHRSQGQPQRTKIIARDMAYHGTTLGALAVTGVAKYQQGSGPLMPGVFHVPNTLGEKVTDPAQAAGLPSISAIVETLEAEGPDTFAAIFAEPVQNSRGALVPPPGYWQQLRAICDKYGVLLVADEVICGFGRLGEWFGTEKFGALPDMITFAKGVTSGYVPLGGLIIADGLAHGLMDSPHGGTFAHGATWGGHPVSTAVAQANIRALRDEQVLENVRRLEPSFQSMLDGVVAAHPSVLEWRGTGFFYAVEFTSDRRTGRPLTSEQSVRLIREIIPAALRRAHLITRPDDRGATMLMICPPLIANIDVLRELMSGVDAVAAAVDAFVGCR